MIDRPTVRWLVAALAIGVALWIRLLVAWATVEPASAVTGIDDASGAPASCHGAAIVDGDAAWMHCTRGSEVSFVRFELRHGTADWRFRTTTKLSVLAGAVHDGAGGLVVLLDEFGPIELHQLRNDGAVVPLRAPSEGPAVGLAWATDHAEVVVGRMGPARIVAARADGFTERVLDPAPGPTRHAMLQSARHRDGRWEAVFLVHPQRGALPVEADLVSVREGEAPRVLQTVTLDSDHATASDGHVYVIRPLLDTVEGNVLPHDPLLSSRPLLVREGDRFVAAAQVPAPIAAAWLDVDGVFVGDHLQRVLRTKGGAAAFLVHGRWLAAEGIDRVVLRPLDGAAPGPLRDRLGLGTALHALPRTDGGTTLLGSLGSAHATFDANLRRMDAPSFGARLMALFARDHAKLDLYERYAMAKRAAVAFALLAPLALAGLLIASRRARGPFPLRVARGLAMTVVLTAVVVVPLAWPIVSRF